METFKKINTLQYKLMTNIINKTKVKSKKGFEHKTKRKKAMGKAKNKMGDTA